MATQMLVTYLVNIHIKDSQMMIKDIETRKIN